MGRTVVNDVGSANESQEGEENDDFGEHHESDSLVQMTILTKITGRKKAPGLRMNIE